MSKKITIIGCGPGNPMYTTGEAVEAAMSVSVLLGAERLFNIFPLANCRKAVCPSHSAEAIKLIESELKNGNSAGVLVTGDPGICSLAKPIVKHFGAENCQIIPGISAVQVAFARVGSDWFGAKLITAHALQPDSDYSKLVSEDRIAILGGGKGAKQWIGGLAEFLNDNYDIFLCENLTLENERVQNLTLNQLEKSDPASLSITLFIKR